MFPSEDADRTPRAMLLGADPDRLDSWKEIASYLKREVRTVQLWEKREGMPVHRHFHNQSSTVFAFRSEIESWNRQAALRLAAKEQTRANVRMDEAGSPELICAVQLHRVGSEAPAGQPALPAMAARVREYLERIDWNGIASDALQDNELVCPATEAPHAYESSAGFTLRWNTHAGTWQTPRQAQRIEGAQPLRGLLSPADAALGSEDRTTGAREAYLKGRFFLARRTESDLRRAGEWFRLAIQRDPRSALAYSGLADSLTLLSFYEMAPPTETVPEARRVALHAIELDAELAEARTSLADIHLHFDWDWNRAEQQYRRAIECNPNYALSYHWYANLLTARGSHDAARSAMTQALDIDPVSAITQTWAGVTAHFAQDYDAAITHYVSALELDPHFLCAHIYLAQTLEQQGAYAEALERLETAARLSNTSCIQAMRAHILANAGETMLAREHLRTLTSVEGMRCVPSYDIAAAYAALGEISTSILWLDRARRERSMRLFLLARDPRFHALQGTVGFQSVLGHLGLS